MEQKKNDPVNDFLERHIGKLFLFGIIIVFGGYLAFSWFNPEPMPDCAYTDEGCPGNNKFGQ